MGKPIKDEFSNIKDRKKRLKLRRAAHYAKVREEKKYINARWINLPEFLTTTQLADYLRISKVTLKRWERKAWMPIKPMIINPRGDRRYAKQDLGNFLDNQENTFTF